MMNQFLNTPADITAWLNLMGIANYTLTPNSQYGFIIDVEGDVFINEKNLEYIPVKFGSVSGAFSCYDNDLTSLLGCPATVGKFFNCAHNQLTDLAHAPKSVGGDFSCSQNKLVTLKGCPQKIQGDFQSQNNELTSLVGGPEMVEGRFYCRNNQLKTLKGCPTHIEKTFYCENNKIENLEFCPKSIGLYFICKNNPLLGPAQHRTSFQEIFKIHQETLILLEKNNLQAHVFSNPLVTGKIYKI